MLIQVAAAKARVDLLERMAFRWSFVFEIVATCSSLLVFLLIDRFQEHLFGPGIRAATGKLGTSYFGYVTLGLAVSSLSSASLGGVLGQFHEEKRYGSFPLILSSRLSLWGWSVSAGLANFVHAMIQFTMIFGVAVGLLGLRVPSFSLPVAALVILVSAPALWALSVLSLSFSLLLRRGDPLGFVLGLVMELVGGVYAPVDILPAPVRALSRLIPIGPAVEAMQKVVYGGAGIADVSAELRLLLVQSLFFVPVAYGLLVCSDKRARRLGLYFVG